MTRSAGCFRFRLAGAFYALRSSPGRRGRHRGRPAAQGPGVSKVADVLLVVVVVVVTLRVMYVQPSWPRSLGMVVTYTSSVNERVGERSAKCSRASI